MKLPCYLVRDLLPLYKDQVCEPDTAAAVKEHLEECTDCRALWEKMQGIAPAEVEMERTKAREEAAALQRVRAGGSRCYRGGRLRGAGGVCLRQGKLP